ncbi:glycosyltransferase family 4 protein [Bacteroides nordii]|jgi:glycosyltransferase involved in cell wall biosynthesis|uniref:glycosyltransferase family 4 protein n=1 Tax=Bacteroides nordii TaxID=291645 RepID=UPI001F3A347C|nr:glycosyltransferase family 4 protein [Bacteroides nordii]MCE8465151.1 glycosyltransferase family 4 protein [Bacteroides nordii]UYU50810.1 glycosyltransferase family 4 protein [Bacteroides nordii]
MQTLFIVVNVDWFFLSHRKDIALNAQKAGYNVTIVTKDTGKKKEIEALGLKVIDLPMNRSGQNLIEELRTCWFLYNLYRRENPDIVHHVGLKTILWGTLAAKLANVHGVVNAVSGLGVFFSEENRSIISRVLPKVLRFSHHRNNIAVIFQNDEDKSLFLKHRILKESQAYKIKGSGVDLKQYSYTPEPGEGRIKVLLTARMIVEKGIFILTDAAMKLKERYQDKVQFLLCGGLDDNPMAIKENELRVVCDGDYIQWLGYRTDVLDLLKDCHIVAFPSYYKEGLPKSLIEATAVGRPIITTNSIGCKETVVDGYNGYLIPIKDSDTLTDRLSILFENRDIRQKMGQNSRNLAEKDFSIDDVIAKHLEIYKKLVNSVL